MGKRRRATFISHPLDFYLPNELTKLCMQYNTFQICIHCGNQFLTELGCLRCTHIQQKWVYYTIADHSKCKFQHENDQEMWEHIQNTCSRSSLTTCGGGTYSQRWRVKIRFQSSRHQHTRKHASYTYYHVLLSPAWESELMVYDKKYSFYVVNGEHSL